MDQAAVNLDEGDDEDDGDAGAGADVDEVPEDADER
jgi:hypothetical protein